MSSEADNVIHDVEVRQGLAASRPLHSDQTPGQWIKNNLFSSTLNTIITIVSTILVGLLLFFGIRWAVDSEWEIVPT